MIEESGSSETFIKKRLIVVQAFIELSLCTQPRVQDSSQYSLAGQVNEGHRWGFFKKISHKVKGFCSLLGVLGLRLEAWNRFGVGGGVGSCPHGTQSDWGTDRLETTLSVIRVEGEAG